MMGSTGKTTHEKVLRTFLNQNKIIFKVTQFWLKTDSPIEDQISNRERESWNSRLVSAALLPQGVLHSQPV